MCDICSSDICSPLFWDSCSPYFGTFAPPISGHLLIGHLLIGHLLPPFLGHLLPVTILQQSQGKSESEYEKNVFGVLTFRRKITLWTLTTYTISSRWVPFQETMALAVDQIITQLQGEDDDVDEDMDGDDIEGMENEEELPENFIENVKLELIDGNKNEKWLVIDEVHIVFKHTEWSSTVVWRCSGRRRLALQFICIFKCPIKLLV